MTTLSSGYQYSTQLSRHQQYVLSTIERVCSCVSVVASGVVIATFISSSAFRKPINRLIFYASWGNLLSNSATLIAESSLHGRTQGALCQFQGFMIQWFLPADSLWALAMASNVYLAIFKHYDTRRLGMLEWKYLLFCYGVPFIPAFVYLFLSSESRGKVYGESVLWCWVSLRWDFLQIAVFYGPVWFIVLLILAIYIRVGVTIRRQRRELRKTAWPVSEYATDITVLGDVDLHRTARSVPLGSLQRLTNRERSPASTAASSHRIISREVRSPQNDDGPQNARPSIADSLSSNISPTSTTLSRYNYDLGQSETSTTPASAAYYKYAVLFFAALIVTWVPSSANRVYALAASNHYIFGLSCASSFALPLQGFWNSLIYITVSWKAIGTWFRQVGARARRTSSITFRPFQHPLRR
ncbi:hypothetical protein CNMCM8812_002664 [Aspergillus fumigatus]|uniref:G-protein coupled receptors family 2 profile 2 domain-containing protein n=1 Tax=Aspergillus fumigatus TaxID=746128 RepID=A0A9P8NLA8_ASPFM|nr:hypothetical protein CNMCM8812_002664 [Aspergillus fumigatus]KMK58685.1 G protein coupled receptor family protein [Aspergillus fumigatus Z5]KAH1371510.1 hypothetical protein KXX14_003056 [Aspergillus fumigatus]KAH1434183.1 hypothetical protein KXX32_000676 [Aspergillus fumigatus]KAH1906950.1 hypothetical protein KXV57_005011 [Aspergillus fumigatus]